MRNSPKKKPAHRARPLKPHFLLTVARSGSTPIARLIGHYLAQHFQTEYLGEFFDLEIDVPQLIDHQWYFNPNLRRNRQHLAQHFGSEFREYSNPIKHRYIEAQKNRVFFKAFPVHFENKDLKLLQPRFNAYVLYRRDTWQHFLSYVTSWSTDLWYEPRGISIPDKSVRVEKIAVETFFALQKKMERQKRHFPERVEIFYEDFLEKGPAQFLKHIGLAQPTSLDGLRLPSIQSRQNKERLIRNLDEVRAWYKRSKG